MAGKSLWGRALRGAKGVAASAPRFQIAYRRPLFKELLGDSDGVDGVEIVAEHFVGASRTELEELDLVRAQHPITVRGVSLSLGSPEPPDRAHLRDLRRLMARAGAGRLTEQLGLSRAAGVELSAPAPLPRTRAAALRVALHVRDAQDALGAPIVLENIAPLVTTPGTMGEAEFLAEVAERAGCELCLDLFALHAALAGQGGSAQDALEALPLDRVREVHLSGGRAVSRRKLLDTHDGPVPAEVLALFAALAPRAKVLEAVTLERDERIPSLRALKRELDQARAAVGLEAGHAQAG